MVSSFVGFRRAPYFIGNAGLKEQMEFAMASIKKAIAIKVRLREWKCIKDCRMRTSRLRLDIMELRTSHRVLSMR